MAKKRAAVENVDHRNDASKKEPLLNAAKSSRLPYSDGGDIEEEKETTYDKMRHDESTDSKNKVSFHTHLVHVVSRLSFSSN